MIGRLKAGILAIIAPAIAGEAAWSRSPVSESHCRSESVMTRLQPAAAQGTSTVPETPIDLSKRGAR